MADGNGTARESDINGWYEIKGNPLSKVGVYPYLGKNIPGAPDPGRMYNVYRPAEELADPECVESFRLLPWINDHVMLGSESTGYMAPEEKGVGGVIGEDVFFDPDTGTLCGNIKVFSQAHAGLIDAGKTELSCGYRCKYEWSSGVFNGQPYDVIQRCIRGNHLASVDEGRLGPEVAVMDGKFSITFDAKELLPMADETESTGENENANVDAGADATTIADALAAIKAIMPAIALIQKFMADNAPADTDADTDAVGADADGDAKVSTSATDEDDADKKDDGKKDEAAAMDAMERTVVERVARRDALAKKLTPFVGTFDHSAMTERDLAKYGVKKLGIPCAAGQEPIALAGYLHGRKAPKDEPTTRQGHAMDAADVNNNPLAKQYNARGGKN